MIHHLLLTHNRVPETGVIAPFKPAKVAGFGNTEVPATDAACGMVAAFRAVRRRRWSWSWSVHPNISVSRPELTAAPHVIPAKVAGIGLVVVNAEGAVWAEAGVSSWRWSWSWGVRPNVMVVVPEPGIKTSHAEFTMNAGIGLVVGKAEVTVDVGAGVRTGMAIAGLRLSENGAGGAAMQWVLNDGAGAGLRSAIAFRRAARPATPVADLTAARIIAGPRLREGRAGRSTA